ncbi:MAG TPA: CHASE2 domain-containing protein, partial [Xanthomonadaceae bacterium]|nr:CHASE2 domain-containing protein [Xanthomonadaceae bacterium]
MTKTVLQRWISRFEAAMARLGHAFVRNWGRLERGYRRPGARFALRMKHEFYPLLAVIALAWLGWDWQHARSLDAAEDALFDKVIKMRPWERPPSGKVAIVEIDDCSLAHLRAQGMGSWPWSRQLHADLLDRLDRAGARAVGIDVLFVERSTSDPDGDATLEAMAQGGAGRFVFAASRMAQDYDENATLPVSKAPAAFPLVDAPRRDPAVALMLPFGTAMARHAALVDVTRAQDGVLRDVPLRVMVGDWAIPALPLRLAVGTDRAKLAAAGPSVRVNWRTRTRLTRVSAADVFADGEAICREAGTPMPDL